MIQAIDTALKRRGLSAAAASKEAVGNPSAIKNIQGLLERGPGERANALHNLLKIADFLGLELSLEPPKSDQSERPRSNHEAVQLLDQFAFVERFDVSLSAGPGAAGDNARHLAPVAFRRDWLTERGLIANKCVVCSVGGDSMEPLLSDGDLVLLDRRYAELREGEIYGIVDVAGDTRVKRLEKIGNGLLLRSENPDFPSEARMGDDANRVHIIGRLVWSGHAHDNIRQRSKPTPKKRSAFQHTWF